MAEEEKVRLVQQIPFRLHRDDHIMMKKLLAEEGLKFQTLVDATVQAYLRGDRTIMKVVKDYLELNTVPREIRDQYNLSARERGKIFDELEAAKGTK